MPYIVGRGLDGVSPDELPPLNFTLAKGQDWPLEITIFGPEKSIRLSGTAADGATDLFVEADHPALDNGDKFRFGEYITVTLTNDVDAGDRHIPVSALAGPIEAGETGELLRDLTGYTIQLEALEDGADAAPVFTKSGADVVIPSQAGADRGKVQIAGAAADWASSEPGAYPFWAWRRDSGQKRPIARGTINLEAQGFL